MPVRPGVVLPVISDGFAASPARPVAGKHAVQALLPEELAELAGGIKPVEARKLVSCVHRLGALPERSPAEVRRTSLEAVKAVASQPSLKLIARTPSSVDPFVKYTLATDDGGVIETVRIPLERQGRFSVCVSSQVGCGLACRFCATGRLGLKRNLKAWEIVEQVRMVRADLPPGTRVHGVVFQGMGEPLSNWKEVERAAKVLFDPCAQSIDARNITISTAGLPTGILTLARALPKIRLALSIGSALAEKRRELIPIDATHPLDTVLEAVGEHTQSTGHAPLFAYTLLSNVNDTLDDAAALARLVSAFSARYGKRPRLSLIPYNAIGDDDPFQRSSDQAYAHFQSALVSYGVMPTLRYSGGGDVGAACGQLASRAQGP